MIENAKRIGYWVGVAIGSVTFAMACILLPTVGLTYLSMSMDSLDQPLKSYYNLNDPLGKRFYQLSQSHSSREHKFLIVPGSIGEEGLKSMLSSDGWDIADYRWVKPSRILSYRNELHGGEKVVSAQAFTESVGNGTFCDINMPDITQASSYHRLLNGDKGATYYALFSHELGHCIHALFDKHSKLVSAGNVLKDDLSSIVDLEFKDQAIQWTNRWGDDNLPEMHHRYLREAFAQVYAYSHMTHEKGYDPQQIHDLLTKTNASMFKSSGGAVSFTAPFVWEAHKNRDKISGFSSAAEFADYFVRTTKFNSPQSLNSFLVAHLVMSGKIGMSEVKDEFRVNSAMKFVRLFR